MYKLPKNRIDRHSIWYSTLVGFKRSAAFTLLLILLVSALSHNKLQAQTCNATITTIAGTGSLGFSGDGGAATAARMRRAYGIAIDNSGNIYLTDNGNQRIRKITTDGTITTIAGTGTAGYSGDGGPATAANLWGPRGIALDATGNIYVADENNYRIRKITPAGIISTVVGSGTYGFAGDGGQATAARLASPASLAFDASGNMYIADMGNNRIRKVTTSGVISTIAGNGTSSPTGDGGQATAAAMPLPHGITLDQAGNIYVTNHSTHRVRKIAPSGIITTIAGTGTAGTTGNGAAATAAQINAPYGVHIDTSGNIYIACMTGNNIRKISPAGIISTFAGSGAAGYFGDNGAATAASLYEPYAIANDPAGNIYIVDSRNYRIRKVTSGPPTITLTGSSNICSGSFSPLTASATGGTWTSSNVTVATVGTSGLVSGISSGTAIISYSNTYDCGTALATKIVTVSSPTTTPTITGSTNVCVGSGTTLSGTPSGGTWTSSATAIATINSSSGFVNPLTVGTTTISYSVSASCGTYIVTSTLTVNASTSAGTTSGPSSVCMGSTITLTNSVGGGTWNSSNTAFATVNSAGVVTPLTPGSVVNISYTVSGLCGLVSTNKIVTVNGLPYPGDISGNDSFCVGGSRTLSIYGAVGGTWSSSNTSVVTVVSSGSSTATITGVSGGNAIISYTSTNTCGSVTATYDIRIDAVLSTGSISGPVSVAVDSSILLSSTSSSGNWYSSNMYLASIDTAGILTGHEAGTVIVSYLSSNSCGTFVSTYPITVTPSAGSTTSCNNIITTIAGNGTTGFSGDGGPATAASMNNTHGLTVDSVGNVYFTDLYNHRIRKVNTSGIISTVAGNGISSYSGDGGPATAAGISQPTGVAFDRHGNMFICDQGTNRIRKVSPSGIITTIAGTGLSGYNGDGIPATAANIFSPKNIAIDKNDNIYIADYGHYRVRKVSPSGIISTIAGNGSTTYSGDYGQATAAGLFPYDVDVDEQGNVYVATYNQYRIRKIVPSGKIYTVAGGGLSGHHTEGGAATSTFLYQPLGVAVDKSGNLYCSAFGDHKVYKVSPLGTINIIAGTGTPGYTGDGVLGNTSALNYPRDVAVDKSGNLYIADDYNQRIRRVRTAGAPPVSGIYGPDTLCVGASLTLIDTTAGGTWISTETSVATVSAAGVVTGINSGNTVIRYYKGNDCGIGGQSLIMRINGPAFAGNPYGTFSACVGSTATVMSSIPGGSWSSADNSIATVNPSTGLVTGISPGLVNISYTVPGTCGSGYTLKQFTVNGTTATGTISGSDTICAGTYTILTSSLSGGSWSSANPSVATVGGDGNVYGVSAGTTIISYYAASSCGVSTASKILTVLPTVSVGSIAGPATLCLGTPTTYTNTSSGGNWSSSNTSVATIDSSGFLTPLTAGVTAISYTVTNECGATTTSISVTINTAPSPDSISGASMLCSGDTTSLLTTTAAGSWSSAHPTIANVDSFGIVTALATGTAIISYTVTNECGSYTATKSILVNTTPDVDSIIGLSAICAGSTTPMSNVTEGGYWSSSNAEVASVDSAGVVLGGTTGTTTISYTVSNDCGTVSATKTITVNPLPDAGMLTGGESVCIGSELTLYSSVEGGTWSSSGDVVSVTTDGDVTGLSAGTASITYTVINTCGIDTATINIAVNTTPDAGVVTGDSIVCVGTTASFSNTSSGGSWSSSNATIASVGSTGLVAGNTIGTAIISYNLGNECGTSSATKTITVNPLPDAGMLTGGESVCIGSELTLYSSVEGGTWSSSSELVSVATDGDVTGLSAGIASIIYTVTNACGTDTATINISVNTAPDAGIVTGDSIICLGSTISFSNTTTGGSWSSSNATVASVGSTGLVAGNTTGTAIISYNIGNECGTSVATKTITVNPLPVAGLLTGGESVCVGSELTLYSSVEGGTWSSSSDVVSVTTDGDVTGLSTGIASITYTVTNACGFDAATINIAVNTTPDAGIITGDFIICVGSTASFSNTNSGGSWSSSNGTVATIGSTGLVAGNTTGTAIISYSISNECGSAFATKTITVNPLPDAGTITGASSVNSGSSISLSYTIAGGTWSSSNPDVATVSSTGIVTGESAGTVVISYTITNSCGSESTTKTITVNAVLETGITGTLTVCVGSTTLLSNVTTGGTWSSSNTTRAIVNAEGVVTGVSVGTVTISYTLSGTSVSAVVTVIAAPTVGAISGSSSVCAGSNITLTIPTSGGTWSSTDVAVATVGSTGIVSSTAAGTTTISYTVSSGCGNIAATKVVTVIALPAAGIISGASSICRTNTTTLSSTVAGGTWSSNYAAGASVNTSTGLVTGLAAGSFTISYRMTNACGTSYAMFPITVLNAPTLGTISGTATVCASSTTTLSNTTTGGTWSSTNTGVATIGVATSGAVTGVAAGTATVSYTVTNICGSATATRVVTVNPLPVAAVITGAAALSAGTTTTLTATPAAGTWLSGSGAIASVNAAGVVTGVSAGIATISYNRSNTCGIATATVAVTVSAATTPITGTRTVCEGSTTNLTNATAGGTWSTADVATAVVNTTTGVVTGVAAGTTTITYTFSSGGNVTATVTVNAAPAAYTGSGILCSGSQLNLGSIIPGCTWTSGSTARATVVAATGIVTGGTTLGTVSISYTNAAGCRTTTQLTVTAAVALITGVSSPCVGSTFTALNATVGGAWSSSNTARATIDASSGLLTAISGGTVTISYTISAGCVRTTTVTVGTPPAITGNPNVCLGQTSYMASSGGVWNGSSNPAVASLAANGFVTGVSEGTAIITYRSSSNPTCFVTQTLTVNPLPSVIVPVALCPTETATLTSAPAGGTWTSSNSSTVSVDSITGLVTGIYYSSGISVANITYTLPTTCSRSAVVTVNPAPAPISGGTANICLASSLSLSNSSAGAWSSANPSIATITAGGVVTGASEGLATISFTNSVGCARTLVVTVNAIPGANSGTPSLCRTATTTLSNAAGAGTWTSSNSSTASVGMSTGIVTGTNVGTANITYTRAAGCTSVTVVTVNSCARPGMSEGNDGDNSVFSVSPNPTTGAINLTTDVAGQIEVYTIDGKQLQQYEAKAGTTAITLPSGIVSGLYMLRFNGADGSSKMVRLEYQQ